jgi:hypothetical protein
MHQDKLRLLVFVSLHSEELQLSHQLQAGLFSDGLAGGGTGGQALLVQHLPAKDRHPLSFSTSSLARSWMGWCISNTMRPCRAKKSVQVSNIAPEASDRVEASGGLNGGESLHSGEIAD